MNLVHYKIKKGDSLESIASGFNLNVAELLSFHNKNAVMTQQIYGKEIPLHISHLIVNPMVTINENSSAEDLGEINFNKNYLYRTEMIVGTVLEQVMVDNSTCKSQYKVGLNENNTLASVLLQETHVKSSPQMMQAGMELIAEIDKIKCNSVFRIDPDTGKIKTIINYKAILDHWNQYKSGLESRKTVLKMSQNRKDIDDFIAGVEAILIPEKSLIEDYYNKMFYELFFTKHLFGNTDFLQEYSRTYYSTLFDKEEIQLKFTPTILEETDDILKIRRVSEMDYPSLNMEKIINLYNERIKPMVQFNFSEYNFSYRETLIWNKKDNVLQESHVTVIEEVKNNIQLLIDFNLKRFE